MTEPQAVDLSRTNAFRRLSSTRLKTILTIFIVAVVLGESGVTLGLVWRMFDEFDASVLSDLRWKTSRAPRELAIAADVAMAIGDGAMVSESFRDYRGNPDVEAIVVVDSKGKLLARYGQPSEDAGRLFLGTEGELRENDRSLSSWRRATIEGQNVGQVAVVISKQRLQAGFQLRNHILLLAGGGSVVAIIGSFVFVAFYLGPLLRFTEETFRKMVELNATLEERVNERTAALTHANGNLEESLQKLHATQTQLVDASRRAGMADVATTVLHNVGNVLNSVNVSSEFLLESARSSSMEKLERMAAMMRAHKGDLGDYFAHDPKGRKMPPFLLLLADAAGDERRRATLEAESLRENVDHIKNIISRQQEFTRTRAGVIENIAVDELIDTVLRMVAPSFEKRGIDVARGADGGLRVAVDRHKMVEVLMNVLTNARQAVEDNPGAKIVRVNVCRKQTAAAGRVEADRILIEIADNGSGIVPGNMAKLFEQGFTTKKTGHGFGLHGSACAMMEMGGALRVHSDGQGLGATFTMELVAAEAVVSMENRAAG